jgi:hypothetical protein
MEPIVAQLMENIGDNQNATRYTDCQARDVDKRESLMFPKMGEGDFKVIFQHSDLLKAKKCNKHAICKIILFNPKKVPQIHNDCSIPDRKCPIMDISRIFSLRNSQGRVGTIFAHNTEVKVKESWNDHIEEKSCIEII